MLVKFAIRFVAGLSPFGRAVLAFVLAAFFTSNAATGWLYELTGVYPRIAYRIDTFLDFALFGPLGWPVGVAVLAGLTVLAPFAAYRRGVREAAHTVSARVSRERSTAVRRSATTGRNAMAAGRSRGGFASRARAVR